MNFSFVVGRHAFYTLFNPTDVQLRALMVRQRDANDAPVQIVAAQGKHVTGEFHVATHTIGLAETEGRATCDLEAWMVTAGATAQILPLICGMQSADCRKAKWHHAYFVVPDDTAHPLYHLVD